MSCPDYCQLLGPSQFTAQSEDLHQNMRDATLYSLFSHQVAKAVSINQFQIHHSIMSSQVVLTTYEMQAGLQEKTCKLVMLRLDNSSLSNRESLLLYGFSYEIFFY